MFGMCLYPSYINVMNYSIKSNLEKIKNGLYFVRFINQKSKYSSSIIKQN